jgi:hypothetical protein
MPFITACENDDHYDFCVQQEASAAAAEAEAEARAQAEANYGYKETQEFYNWGYFTPKNDIEKKLDIILKSNDNLIPNNIVIIREEKNRSEKWPQEWSGDIIIYNIITNKYFCFEVMGTDQDQVTDMLDFYEVKKVTANQNITDFIKT